MKYYIPTSSLNLDAILQSESISPISYYSQRKSGYNTFEQITECISNNSIVLFDYPVSFQINDIGRYNYPLLIEIEDEEQLQDIQKSKNEGVFFCSHTIALTPNNCRLFFFTEQAYKLTTINAKDNRSIKYYKDYKIYPNTSGLFLKPMPRFESQPIDIVESQENLMDKMKGVCYGSLLGQRMSVNNNLAHQLNLSQKLYDVLTSIISTPSSAYSYQKQLENLLDEYRRCDKTEQDNVNKFNDSWDRTIKKHGVAWFFRNTFLTIIKELGLYKPLCGKWNCDMLPEVSELSTKHDYESMRSTIEHRTSSCVSNFRNNRKVSIIELEKVEERIALKHYPLINIAINYIVDRKLTPDVLIANRLDICVEMLKLQQAEICKEKGESYWNDSPEKKYFNSLFYHIRDGYDFSLKSVGNKELIATAIFILRGNNINSFFDYLVLNEIEDYQLPLTLWGALCGYMEMDREILQPILTMENYDAIYRLVYDRSIDSVKNAKVKGQKESKTDDVRENIFEVSQNTEQTNSSKTNNEDLKNKYTQIPNQFECLFHSEKFKSLSQEAQNYARKEVMKLWHDNQDCIDDALIASIRENIFTKRGKKQLVTYSEWNKIVDFAFPGSKKAQSSKTKSSKKNLGKQEEIDFIETFSIQNLECCKGLSNDQLERLTFWWKVASAKYPDSKAETINFFLNCCKKEGRGEFKNQHQALRGYFTEEIAEIFEKELYEKL